MMPVSVQRSLVRTISSHNRAVRPLVMLLAICCCLSAVDAQWLEKTIALSDSFGSIWPRAVYCVPGRNWVYVADEEERGVIVVDAATNARVARIEVRSFSLLAYDSRDDKVYFGCYDSAVAVNPSTHQVISRIEVGSGPSALSYNSVVNKLYCRTGGDNDSVTVVAVSYTHLTLPTIYSV